jgi:hypothetical protein
MVGVVGSSPIAPTIPFLLLRYPSVGFPGADDAEIDEAKILGYLLSTTHQAGQSKAAFFRKHGFTAERWQRLAAALRAQAKAGTVTAIKATPYGMRYVVDGPLLAPDGTSLNVRTVWFITESRTPVIRELDQVVLERDLPEFGLKRGDVATVVLVHDAGAGYEVEFNALDGETVAVTTLARNELREVNGGEIAHARGLAHAS